MRKGFRHLNYFRPQSLSDALSALAERKMRIAGGCTDLFAATANPHLDGPMLDVTGIGGLRGITETAEHWRFGAATTWTDIIKKDLPAAFDGLKLAAREIGSVQIQNSATIAGNICNASPAADGVPPLLVLDAEVELMSLAGKRTLPVQEFILGPRTTALEDTELVTAVIVPKSATQGNSGFVKLGARKYLVISIVMTAIRIVEDEGKISEIAIAVGSCSPVATRLKQLESRLTGLECKPALAELVTQEIVMESLSPIGDVRASANYRKDAATEVVRRIVELAGAKA